jgi:hypothetical protein
MLVNIVWLTPEIFLSGVTISLLGFGAIYSLLNKGEISQQKKNNFIICNDSSIYSYFRKSSI